MLLGAFATEVAASTWEEIQKENDIDLLEKPVGEVEMGTDTSMQNSLASTQFFRMLGVSGDDLGEAVLSNIYSGCPQLLGCLPRTEVDIEENIDRFNLKDGVESERDWQCGKSESLGQILSIKSIS